MWWATGVHDTNTLGLAVLVKVGDVLHEVNRTNVYCTNPEEIGGLLLGYEGTQVCCAITSMSFLVC